MAGVPVALGQSYTPAGGAYNGGAYQGQQMMSSGSSYSGTVYEPFTNTTPSEANSPAKAPSGPRKGFYNPGEGGSQSDQSPIGEPWVLAIFALAFAGVVAVRRRKKA